MEINTLEVINQQIDFKESTKKVEENNIKKMFDDLMEMLENGRKYVEDKSQNQNLEKAINPKYVVPF
ncbi:MAG: hypothetical protein AB7D41_04605 [Arcobacter sp.]|uniref:hypothetical protein n=1 Tax=Arcobacter sp. TaxID=1872629 RepID=UPI003CFFCD16